MVWKILLILAAALALIYLGSLSVWVTVFALSIKILLALIGTMILGITGVYLWKRYRTRQVKQLAYRL